MEIYFRTNKLQKICNNKKIMEKKLGSQMSFKLQQRLFELSAADNLNDISHLSPTRLHELTGNRKGQFSVDLIHPFRLLFIIANDPVPYLETGGIDREKVNQIEIIEISDTH